MAGDTLEDFNAKSAASNSSNNINSVLFTLYKVFPGDEDVSAFLNVNVATCTGFMGVEGEVKVALEHVSEVSSVSQSLFKLLLFS